MARPPSRHPTELELEILKIAWRDGAVSVRHVRDALAPSRDLAYNSILTMMNIMTRKGYLRREKREDGSYIYHSQISQRSTSRGMLRDLVKRLFGGSALAAIQNLLQTGEIDQDELGELRKLLDRKDPGDKR